MSSLMLNVKLEELPMPTTDRSIDRLVGWFVESFCFVRRKGDATADYGSASPIHRMLRDHFFSQPTKSWDAQELSDELAMTPAALNHHLSRLSQSGLLSYTNEGKGWRTYILRGGSLSRSLELCFSQYGLILEQKMDQLGLSWNREGLALENEIAEESPLPLNLSITDYRPEQEGASELTQWMADFGLLGDRPGNELLKNSVSEQLFTLLLNTGNPISLDDAHEQFGGQKARLGRILERIDSYPHCGLQWSHSISAVVKTGFSKKEVSCGSFLKRITTHCFSPSVKVNSPSKWSRIPCKTSELRIKCFCSIFSADGYRWVTDSSVFQLMIQNRTSLLDSTDCYEESDESAR